MHIHQITLPQSHVAWVRAAHAAHVAIGSASGPTRAHYAVTSGVDAPRYPLIDPSATTGELFDEGASHTTTYCVLVGLRATETTNVATVCGVNVLPDNRCVQTIQVLLWDEKLGVWADAKSITTTR
jgi:hypothetical protein